MPLIGNLEFQISQALRADRSRLRGLLRAVEKAQREGRPFDRNLARLTEGLERSVAVRLRRQQGVPAVRFDEELPIAARREEISRAISDHQTVVICGETGSGKSTQLPKICLALGRGVEGMIGHTQPRRIAARSVASRVAAELGSPLGREVGFKVRFHDATGPQTYVKLMTDGILLAESQHDRLLEQYDTIILDEAHERSLNIDFLLGYLKRLLPKRPDLKLIITSATIDVERFSRHFATEAGPAPVVEVSGRTYPVELRYRPPAAADDDEESDWRQGVLDAVEELAAEGRGDMLIFMPTEREIHEAAKALRGRKLPGDSAGRTTEILPLYARLSAAEQDRAFTPHPHRRIVIATNVAESSLTVPGIRYVIDPGTARISRYAPRSKVQRLPIEAVSRASADQRMGRCGRVGPGICIRLYSQDDYAARERFTPPEIQRTNLAAVILQAMSLGLGRIDEFPFLDPPRPDAIRDGYKTLFELGAIDERNGLTGLGRRLARLPADPRIGRIILAGHDEGCLHEALIIAAALEVRDPRERPLEKQQAADECHARFADENSDFLSYLKLWDFYHKLLADLSRSKLRKACQQNFLSHNRMREWLDVHRELLQIVEEAGMKPAARRDDGAAIHRALLAGLLSNVALRADGHEYAAAGGGTFHLWPGSGLFAKSPRWVVAAELVETTRRYLRTVGRIDPAWIEPLAGHLVKRTWNDPHWDAKNASARAFEKVTLFGLPIVSGRRVRYGPIDPTMSRELFIQHALVQGEFDTRARFVEHNRRLVEELSKLEAKMRRRGLLLGDEARYEFYDHRLPADVLDGASFERWRRQAEAGDREFLCMTPADLLAEDEAAPAPAAFPDAVEVQAMQLPLEYRYEPADARDGVTVTVPQEGLAQLDRHRLGWLVPGLLAEKVEALIRSLPKPIRTRFVPVPDTAKAVAGRLAFGQGSLIAAVAEALGRIGGAPVPLSAFQEEKLPTHLRMNVRVVDAQGADVACGRDLAEIRRELLGEQAPAVKAAGKESGGKPGSGKTGGGRTGPVKSGGAPRDAGQRATPEPPAAVAISTVEHPGWQRDGSTTWDYGNLPEFVEIERHGVTLRAWPALLDRENTVSLRLLGSAEQAAESTRGGLRRLCFLAAARDLKQQVSWLPSLDQIRLLAGTWERGAAAGGLTGQLALLLAERTFQADEPGQAVRAPRNEAEFQNFLTRGRQRLGVAVQELAALMAPLWQAYHEAALAIERAGALHFQPAVQDAREQLARLTPPDFLIAMPWSRLSQYPRYLRAIRLRFEKLSGGRLSQDQRNLAAFQPRWQAYLDRARQHEEHGIFDHELVLYRWMLEEYRVSLFAQELGTSQPVSEKRLEKQWAKVRV